VSRFVPIIHRGKIIGGTINGVRVQENDVSHEGKLTVCSGENNFPGIAVLLDRVGICFSYPYLPVDFLQKLWLDVTETLPIPGQLGVSSLLKIEGEYREGDADFTDLSSLKNEGFNLSRPNQNLVEVEFGWISGPDAGRTAYLTQEEATEFGKFIKLAEKGFTAHKPYWDVKLLDDQVLQLNISRYRPGCPPDCVGQMLPGNCDLCRAIEKRWIEGLPPQRPLW